MAAATRVNAYKEDETKVEERGETIERRKEDGNSRRYREHTVTVLDLRVNIRGVPYLPCNLCSKKCAINFERNFF